MNNTRELQATVEQLALVISAFNDLHRDVGAANPKLYVVMSEAYIDQICDLHRDLERLLQPSFNDGPTTASPPLPSLLDPVTSPSIHT